jgi:hypothetical protein
MRRAQRPLQLERRLRLPLGRLQAERYVHGEEPQLLRESERRTSYATRFAPPALHEKRGKLEVAQQIAANESPRTTKLYDCNAGTITLHEIERIAF